MQPFNKRNITFNSSWDRGYLTTNVELDGVNIVSFTSLSTDTGDALAKLFSETSENRALFLLLVKKILTDNLIYTVHFKELNKVKIEYEHVCSSLNFLKFVYFS